LKTAPSLLAAFHFVEFPEEFDLIPDQTETNQQRNHSRCRVANLALHETPCAEAKAQQYRYRDEEQMKRLE
jgi:hypothetical protein